MHAHNFVVTAIVVVPLPHVCDPLPPLSLLSRYIYVLQSIFISSHFTDHHYGGAQPYSLPPPQSSFLSFSRLQKTPLIYHCNFGRPAGLVGRALS